MLSLHQGLLDSGILFRSKSIAIFPERNIQLFLATMYIVQILNDEEEIETFFGRNSEKSDIMKNMLFVYFCLHLLSNQTDLPSVNKDKVLQKFETFFFKEIDCVQLDLNDFSSQYPLVTLASRCEDKNSMRFLKELLSKCTKTKIVHLNPDLPVSEVLSAHLENLESIYFTKSLDSVHRDVLRQADPSTLNVFVQSHSDFQQLLDFLNNLGKRYSLFFLGNKDSKPVIDLGEIA